MRKSERALTPEIEPPEKGRRLSEFLDGISLTGLSALQRSILATAFAARGDGRRFDPGVATYPEIRERHYGATAGLPSSRAALCRSVSRLERLGLVERRYRIIRGGGGVALTSAGIEAAQRLERLELDA